MGERKLSFKPIDLREADFKRAVNSFVKYPQDMRTEFFEYWSEPDRAPQPKMKFEKEKTWDLSRRLARWAKHDFGKGPRIQAPVVHIETKKRMPDPVNDIDRLDQLLAKYSARPTTYTIEHLSKNWPVEALNNCYKAIKENKVFDPTITKQDLEKITDERRLKATVIVRTLDFYGCKGWTFSDTLKLRNHFK